MAKQRKWAGLSQLLVPLIALLALVVFNLIRDPGFFSVGLTTNNNGDPVLQGNLISILNGASELAILAMGMTLVTAASGGQDISVGALATIAASMFIKTLRGSASIGIGTVLLARRLYGWLHDGEPFIFFGDLFSSSNETLTELGQSLSPKARSVINLVLAAFFTVWAIVETVDTLNYAAAEMQVSPEKTVTLQYAQLCLERDEGAVPESSSLTLIPEENWEGGLEDLYVYTFTWQENGAAESCCYGVVLYNDFTCELVGRGSSIDACVTDAERYWRQL